MIGGESSPRPMVNSEGKVIGVTAVKKLNFVPAKVGGDLKGFNEDKEMAYIRICQKVNHNGKLQDRVFIVSRYCLLLTDTSSKVKRYLKFDSVKRSVMQKDSEGVWQLWLSLAHPEHDLLVKFAPDRRNLTDSTEEEFKKMTELYETISSTFLGATTKVEWSTESRDLYNSAQLQKKGNWKSPAEQWRHGRKQSDTSLERMPSVTQSPPVQGVNSVSNTNKNEETARAGQEGAPRFGPPDSEPEPSMSPKASFKNFAVPVSEKKKMAPPQLISTNEPVKFAAESDDDDSDDFGGDGWGPLAFSPQQSVPFTEMLRPLPEGVSSPNSSNPSFKATSPGSPWDRYVPAASPSSSPRPSFSSPNL
eukprot:TRINITY_DN8933_c0_g2_i1.p1 TRINITY_DN8933_c0_g2~~TRINITY_DN8933_c0_g2_i1.p1  ORF type:complete len:362 (+),score=79.22 TRINITY_DN8933_c0_g2_i1:40-1125(+)